MCGKTYRRSELSADPSVDRFLRELVATGELEKLAHGLYFYPKETAFGPSAPRDHDLVQTFLEDDRFLLTSLDHYNTLGVGLTQLHNETLVYNHKRQGKLNLGGRVFTFKLRHHFPKKLDEYFLLVDLANNIKQVGEDVDLLRKRVLKRAAMLDQNKLREVVFEYGDKRAKKLFFPNQSTQRTLHVSP